MTFLECPMTTMAPHTVLQLWTRPDDPATTPSTGALFYNDGTAGTKGLYLYLD